MITKRPRSLTITGGKPLTLAWDLVALAAIGGVAAVLRYRAIGSLPPGVDLDEAREGLEALGVLAGHHPIFFTTFNPLEPAFIYSLWPSLAVLGPTPFALHVVSATWGLAGVLLSYLVARQWFGRWVALLTALGMAGSLWDLLMSRLAGRPITFLPPLLLFLFFFWGGFSRQSGWRFVLAGIFLSLSMYAYVAARILPLLALLIVAGQWLVDRPSVSRNFKGLVGFAAAGMLTAAPLAVFFGVDPFHFFSRLRQIFVFSPPQPGVRPQTLPETVARTLGMFFVSGDKNWVDNVPTLPVFAWWLAVPFCIGVVWAALNLRVSTARVWTKLGVEEPPDADQTRLLPCFWLLSWQLVLLVPAFLSRPSPQFDRTIGTAPSTYMLLALGCAWLCARLKAWRPGAGFIGRLAALSLLGLLVAQTYGQFFGTWAHAAAPQKDFEFGQVYDGEALTRLKVPPDETAFVLGTFSGLPARYVAPGYSSSAWMEDFSQFLPLPSHSPAIYALAEPSLPTNSAQPSIVQEYFPQAAVLARASFLDGKPAALLLQVSSADIQSLEGVARPVNADLNGQFMLETVSAGKTMPAKPGQQIRLGLTWRVLRPLTGNYAAFVHVIDAGGKVVAQSDRQGMETPSWQPGQRFLSLQEFSLPKDLRPGRYRIVAGMDRRTWDIQPSRSLGAIAEPVPLLTLVVE